jgi:phosphoglycolate phosphatase-like HAD superfamily hydrolase
MDHRRIHEAMHICLFDIDGTLLSSGGAGKAAMEIALATAFGAPASAANVPFSGRTDRAIARDLFRLYGIDETAENWQRFLQAYLGHLPLCLNQYQGRVLPGIAALLECLRQRGNVAVGLLTGNVQEGARLKLGHYGIGHHFGFGGFGDHYFDRDEVAVEALTAVREHLGGSVPLERLWVIGDTPLDIRCARAIGAQVLAVATGWHTCEELSAAEPDLLLTDLSDPEPLFERWYRGSNENDGC